MKKAWMISTACAAVLALSGIAAAQGMNEHGSKNAPGASTQQHSQGSTQMNRGTTGAGAAQQMDRAQQTSPKAGAQEHERAGARSTTGESKSTADDKTGGAAKSSERSMDQKPGSAMKDHDQKSGSAMKGHDQKTGAATNDKMQNNSGSAKNDNKHENDAAKTEGTAKNGAKTTTGSAPAAEVKLTTEQRTKIRKVVVEQHKIPRLTKVNFTIKVGVKVPRTVHFYPVPAEIVEIHPAWRSYQVIYVEDELVLIDPTTYEIVYVVTV
jgi:hypothetical protein